MQTSAFLAGLTLTGCAPAPEVIDLGVVPDPQQFAVCSPGAEGYRAAGMSCFDGIQIFSGSTEFGGSRAISPTVKARTAAGLEASFHGNAFGGFTDDSADRFNMDGYFQIEGCDHPEGMRVSSLSNELHAEIKHAAMVGSGHGPNNTRPPEFVYGFVDLEGEALQGQADDLVLRFEGQLNGCSATITVPQSHLAALRQWFAASNQDALTQRQGTIQ